MGAGNTDLINWLGILQHLFFSMRVGHSRDMLQTKLWTRVQHSCLQEIGAGVDQRAIKGHVTCWRFFAGISKSERLIKRVH